MRRHRVFIKNIIFFWNLRIQRSQVPLVCHIISCLDFKGVPAANALVVIGSHVPSHPPPFQSMARLSSSAFIASKSWLENHHPKNHGSLKSPVGTGDPTQTPAKKKHIQTLLFVAGSSDS